MKLGLLFLIVFSYLNANNLEYKIQKTEQKTKKQTNQNHTKEEINKEKEEMAKFLKDLMRDKK